MIDDNQSWLKNEKLFQISVQLWMWTRSTIGCHLCKKVSNRLQLTWTSLIISREKNSTKFPQIKSQIIFQNAMLTIDLRKVFYFQIMFFDFLINLSFLIVLLQMQYSCHASKLSNNIFFYKFNQIFKILKFMKFH